MTSVPRLCRFLISIAATLTYPSPLMPIFHLAGKAARQTDGAVGTPVLSPPKGCPGEPLVFNDVELELGAVTTQPRFQLNKEVAPMLGLGHLLTYKLSGKLRKKPMEFVLVYVNVSVPVAVGGEFTLHSPPVSRLVSTEESKSADWTLSIVLKRCADGGGGAAIAAVGAEEEM